MYKEKHMKNIIIGIDCGLSGAIATLEDDIMSVVAMPVKKQVINIPAFNKFFYLP